MAPERLQPDVAIVGIGLIGGSIARRFVEEGYVVVGTDENRESVLAAERAGVIDEVASYDRLGQAQVVFLCVPPASVLPVLDRLTPHLGPKTCVTDVASAKQVIVEGSDERGLGDRFVGGHPMAGAEVGGWKNADANLFNGAPWILTPTAQTLPSAVKNVERWLDYLGPKVVQMEASEHDRHVALLSHVPHVLASELILQSESLTRSDLGAGSWADLTRVASADPELWGEILQLNRIETAKALRQLATALTDSADRLDGDDLGEVRARLRRSRRLRRL